MTSRGTGFEQMIEAGFEGYAKAWIARLAMMPVPSRVVYVKGRAVVVHTHPAPFDIYGFLIQDGRFVGAELKSTTERAASLPIVGPGKEGSGLQFHQLNALLQVASSGGIARLVWENGGEVGVIGNDKLTVAHSVFSHALACERNNNESPPGSKSIRWELFEHLEPAVIGGVPTYPWLLP
jgi:penicillin-binding protein-related factor A (putative recombinase)